MAQRNNPPDNKANRVPMRVLPNNLQFRGLAGRIKIVRKEVHQPIQETVIALQGNVRAQAAAGARARVAGIRATFMDKLVDAYKATVAVFHGIIATWLFLEFSETKVDQFYFVILLIFFTIANILIWRWILQLAASVGLRAEPFNNLTVELPTRPLRHNDVIGLTLVAVSIGLGAAYLQRKDVVLRFANYVTDWERASSKMPFGLLLSNVINHTMNLLDKRDPELVKAAKGGAFLRVYVKDSNVGYEGYPGWIPGRLDDREIIFTPACRFILDSNDPTKIMSLQRIEGPGVYLRLTTLVAIEIIDVNQSPCFKLN